jgi:GTP cyclohydrolase I
MAEADLQAIVAQLLKEIDPEPEREGLVKTPERVARALAYLTRGYEQDPETIIKSAWGWFESHPKGYKPTD